MTAPSLPPASQSHDVENIRGLLLASFLSTEGLMLLLGCDEDQALAYRHRNQDRVMGLNMAISRARPQ